LTMIEWQSEAEKVTASRAKRSVVSSLLHGFIGACPNCGKRGLFRAFLKPVDNCRHCGEDMSHQRADDAPPYFTMLIVGHVVVPLMLTVAMLESSELSFTFHVKKSVPWNDVSGV